MLSVIAFWNDDPVEGRILNVERQCVYSIQEPVRTSTIDVTGALSQDLDKDTMSRMFKYLIQTARLEWEAVVVIS